MQNASLLKKLLLDLLHMRIHLALYDIDCWKCSINFLALIKFFIGTLKNNVRSYPLANTQQRIHQQFAICAGYGSEEKGAESSTYFFRQSVIQGQRFDCMETERQTDGRIPKRSTDQCRESGP